MPDNTINIILEPIYTRKGSLYSIERFIRLKELKLFVIPKIRKLSSKFTIKVFSTDKEVVSFLKSQGIQNVFLIKPDQNKSIAISLNVKKIINRLFKEDYIKDSLVFDGINIKAILEYEIAIKLNETYNKIAKYENSLDEETGTIYLESSNSPDGKIINYISSKHGIELKYINPNVFRKTRDKIVDMMNYRDLNYLKNLNVYSKKSEKSPKNVVLVDAIYVNYLRNIVPVIKEMDDNFNFYFISKEEDLKEFNIEYDILTRFKPESVKNKEISPILSSLFSDKNLLNAFENDKNDFNLFKNEFYDLFERRLPYILFKLRLARNFISEIPPDILIVGDDRSTITRTSILPSKDNDIPVVEIQHGLFSLPEIYVNLMPKPISDKICVWGNSSKDYLLKLGFEEDKIEITGSPEFDEHRKFAENIEDKKNKIILFATQAPYKNINLESIEEMSKNQKLADFIIYVKPHPDEDPVTYKSLEEKYPDKVSIRPKNENLSYLLAVSDVILTISSTVGLESAILDKPLVCINFLGEKSVYVDDGIALEAKNTQELVNCINKVFELDVSARLSKNRYEFIREHVYGLDGKSINRIIKIIKDLI
ncbi:UDP-N-acetylglucosamine 2-epimerase [Methanobacterium oryzae]|uniref:UDP-N-acetylglucosamine 2-epimerase n=1 Tax=Methanobacterium oryzae TaxID=69540 RepID=UPI003D1BA514